MADYKSSEGTRTPIEGKGPRIGDTPPKTRIASNEAYFIRNLIVNREIGDCFDLTPNQVDTILELSREYQSNDKTSIRELKLDVDCSEAIKGLKAMQREAKKATATLKELEEHKAEKLLIVKVDTILTKENHDAIQNRIKQGIEDGVLLLDSYLTDYEIVEGEFKAVVTGRNNVE